MDRAFSKRPYICNVLLSLLMMGKCEDMVGRASSNCVYGCNVLLAFFQKSLEKVDDIEKKSLEKIVFCKSIFLY